MMDEQSWPLRLRAKDSAGSKKATLKYMILLAKALGCELSQVEQLRREGAGLTRRHLDLLRKDIVKIGNSVATNPKTSRKR